MWDIKAETVMTKNVVSARESTPARDIVLQLLSGHYTGMPVLDDEGRILGVVTEIDLLEAIKEGKSLSRTTAGEIMTKGAVTADVDAPLSKLIATMKEKNILRLFITAQGKLAGIVARVDILKSQIEPEFYVL